MNVNKILEKGLKAFSNRIVLIDGKNKYTYEESNTRMNKFANGMKGLGLKKGDRVAAVSVNSAQSNEVDYGLIKAGIIMVALNLRSTPSELRYMINNSEAKAVVCSPEYIDSINEIRGDLEHTEHLICLYDSPKDMIDYETLLSSSSSDDPNVVVDSEEVASFLYTSGTTGRLKAAMLTHKNWVARCMNTMAEIDHITEDEVNLSVAPMRHTGPILFLPFYLSGAATVIVNGFDVKTVLDIIEREKVTRTLMVPSMINAIMDYRNLDDYDLTSIKSIMYGASPMPIQLLQRSIRKLGMVFEQLYALSEALPMVTFLHKSNHKIDGSEKGLKHLASAGRPGKGVEVAIVDEDGNEVPIGAVGEIATRGNHVMAGYWGEPELTAKSLKNGWFYTGDMAYRDEDGFYYLVDRKKDLIISGGFNVYPNEVETLIYKHSSVSEVAVIGVPSKRWGEEVKAIIFLRPTMPCTEEEIIKLCRDELSDYKCPKTVEFLENPLPKSGVGKILKREIREKYWEGYDRRIN